MMDRICVASKDWILGQIESLFIRHEAQPAEPVQYEINADAGVIRIDESMHRDSFVAGLKACDELHRIGGAEAKSHGIPLYDILKEPS